jgi:sugar phosphate isomerase/epimerase
MSKPTRYTLVACTAALLLTPLAALATEGASIVAISAENDFSTPDERDWEVHAQRIEQWVEIAAALGTRTIRINSGSWFCHDEDDGTARLIKGLRRIGPLAKSRGVTLAIENHPLDLASSTQARILAEIACDLEEFNVATCPDIPSSRGAPSPFTVE